MSSPADYKRFKPLFAILWFLVLVAVGRDLSTEGKTLTIAVLFVVTLGVALVRPKAALVVLIVAVFTLDWLGAVTPFIPSKVSWLQEVMLLALATAALFKGIKRHGFATTPVDKQVILLLLLGAASALINLSNPVIFLLGMRNYWKFLLLFYAVVNLEFEEQFRRRIIWLLFGFAALQVPVALIQRITSPLRTGDVVGGTLGVYTSGTLTILLLAASSMVLGWYLYNPRSDYRTLLGGSLLLLPTAINETKVVFIAGPILYVYLLWARARARFSRVALVMIVLLSVGYGAYQAYDVFYAPKAGASVFSRSYLEEYLLSERIEGGVLNRLPGALFAFRDIAETPQTLIFGHGPGAASDSTFEFGVGPVYILYGNLKVDSTFVQRFSLEYGLAGWFVLLWMARTLLRTTKYVRNEDSDWMWRGMALGLEGTIALMLGLAVYTGTFTIDVLAMWLWVFAAFAVVRSGEIAGYDLSAPLGQTLAEE